MNSIVLFISFVIFFGNFFADNEAAIKIELPEKDLEKLIVNETSIADFKYVAALVFKEAVCTGAIIGDNYVVSAGHCFIREDGEFENESTKVVAGTNYINDTNFENKVEVNVEKVYVPASYYRKKYWKIKKSLPPHDIAVIKLEKSLNISENPNLEAVVLPPKNSPETYMNMTAIVAGYGYNNVNVTEESDGSERKEYTSDEKLHWASSVVMQNRDCRGEHYVKVDDAQLCAQMKKNRSDIFGTCGGDSGAPLVYTSDNGSKVLIGVQTGVRGCNEALHPALYTRVTSHVEFIELVVQGKADRSTARQINLPIADVTDDHIKDKIIN